ncbi:MAG: HEAT repeat domain-containing protein [Planctomycetota bacterium JB042]
MKLFFCDICNESIPLQDIKENRSTTIKGKIFCRKCNPLNELGPDAGSGSGSGAQAPSGLLAVVAVLLVLVVSGLAYVIYDLKFTEQAPPEAGRATALADLESRVGDLRAAVTVLQKAYEDLDELRDLPARIQSLQEEAASRGSLQTRLSKEVSALQDGLVAVGKLRERVEGLSLLQEETGQKMDRIFKQLDAIGRDLTEIGERPPVIVSTPTAGDAGGSATPDGPVELDDDLLAIIENLRASDPMVRWEAVDQIRRRRDQALVPHVLPLLDDGDTFVRAQAIYTLGELKAMKAVPKLVKLLRDDEIMIREEALTSLIVITGQNMKFDVTGSRAARDAGIRKWEEWVSNNKEKVG